MCEGRGSSGCAATIARASPESSRAAVETSNSGRVLCGIDINKVAMTSQRLLLGLSAWLSGFLPNTPLWSDDPSICKVLPGDRDWPSTSQWSSLNGTVNGRLIASVPLGSVCHDAPFNNYNADACARLQNTWNKTSLAHMNDPSDVFNMWFKNYTCSPFTPRSQPCELGNLVSYVIDVSSADDVRAGISFAREHNIRLVIKNTGHDYMGKSTGKGGLSLWTHHLNSIEHIPEYKSSRYQGPAMKLGAGVQAFEAAAAAHATGHRVLTGVCPTVGIAGGYSQGGGHSIMSSLYGLGADNVLEWEVVTVDGRHLVASPSQNTDLYWALSGGGPGTFAVVLSMTTRVHPDGLVSGATLAFDDSAVGNDGFWDAVGAFHQLTPDFVDAGNSFFYLITNTALTVYAATMPGIDATGANALLQPFLDDLKARGISPNVQLHVSKNSREHFTTHIGPGDEGWIDYATFSGSRMIPRAVVTNAVSNAVLTQALRNISQAEGYGPIPCEALNLRRAPHPDNAVHPAWRDALLFCVQGGSWDPSGSPEEMARRHDFAVNVMQPMINAATPNGGIYLNEANYEVKDWQHELYGANYARLLEVKRKYDPEALLFARTSVGSEAWVETPDFRLCRAKASLRHEGL
ncbi:hypothetical protein S40285_05754 [Stachybotrys chlorohalonatus IBT 40285]|uniref:FAD-binding PCMH-type domain-containing protein n=1 Tax=Stachybotrys chlorohalonatus (strain IBT 40285) TaxID=1283841 RepID=A0A084QSM4_STAC4|nr:hypothetical protein S40285_05754 [Stachybotrys chlorohalonata IBT 40285]